MYWPVPYSRVLPSAAQSCIVGLLDWAVSIEWTGLFDLATRSGRIERPVRALWSEPAKDHNSRARLAGICRIGIGDKGGLRKELRRWRLRKPELVDNRTD